MTAILVGTTGIVLAALERLPRLRFRPSRFLRAGFASDTVYLLTGYVAGSALAVAYIAVGSQWAGRWLGLPRLAAGLPPWLGVVLALAALDLGNYVAHWLLHRFDLLWEFHKSHHSSPTLDWLATFRSHLVEQALRRLLAPVLVILGGFSTDAVVLGGGLFYAWAMLNHANLRPRLGAIEGVLITPRLHRLHHLPRTTERNLGTVLSCWDRLRGTLVREEATADCRFGIPGELGSYPQGWLRQLGEPLARVLPGARAATTTRRAAP